MATTIMSRATLQPAVNPEYPCQRCNGWHADGSCPAVALGRLVRRVVRETDARIPGDRRARRTLQDMAPGYDRQPVLTLHRPAMREDACVLCGRWGCTGHDCPPAGTSRRTDTPPAPSGGCGLCGGSGVRQVTVNKTGSDGRTYQGVRNEPCPACQ
ncbi:hypothetical protein ACFY7N_31070 [Streptomyces albidoflavus]|uniref:hypothetical protein n=1 Tax=Streptomyces TaxID=1883 RepID=UPI0005644E73|nr:hypothetical protein [Streptomyces sp. NRRL F-6628]